ncbi:cysteine sulfinic acid decarboxylase [Lingula anatina]|uniref:Cysteine sulfinic acid decarboxylase n=1 Tax=Lingula anatina TaxID=7574 RepID=A0A2R2MNC9_LINAN|nr:cysteine sulfinic acid decarboxylase [Lingula anatina]|eukprot:XP_023931572.1 cysteine sulfinic acid decarboxylase [Lingula anatina]
MALSEKMMKYRKVDHQNGADHPFVYNSSGIQNGKHAGSRNGAVGNGMVHVTEQNGSSHNGRHHRSKSQKFLEDVFDMMMSEAVEKGTDPKSKVLEFQQPEELATKLDIQLGHEGCEDGQLLEMCRKTIQYSVKSGHPHFFNQLFQGFDVKGLAGAWVTEALNTSSYTYEMAPAFTLIEQEVLMNLRKLVGYPGGEGDGIFTPGGSIANIYGVNLARFSKFPEIKSKGMQALPRICGFTSQQSHYSLKKAFALLGIGLDNLIPVPCDDTGRMIPSELENAIQQAKNSGAVPFFVGATAGTTVLGAYDPLNAIADICERHQLWMHIDAAWGGGVLFSKKYRHYMEGAHRADSVTWDPHKMMGAPLQCAVFLLKHQKVLNEAHCANACYLFQQDKCYDISYDTGDKSVQCGRKVDAFKLWLMWKERGHKGFERDIDNIFDMSRYLTQLVKDREGFELVLGEPQCTNVCFWYIPPSLRSLKRTAEWWQKLGKVAPKIKERMMVEGTMMVGYQPLGDYVNFIRMVISNLNVTKEDMEFVVDEIERLGKDL